jgi:hypothetical protein
MSDTVPPVVAPHARFLEYQDRRRKLHDIPGATVAPPAPVSNIEDAPPAGRPPAPGAESKA